MRTGAADVRARHERVAALWLKGVPTSAIAGALKLPLRTVQRDLKVVQAELEQANRAHLEVKRARSVAVLRQVQREAWSLFAKLDDAATGKIGALNSIISAESQIARLEGTVTGDHINTQQTINLWGAPEWVRVRSALLAALAPYVEARVAVADAMAALEQEGGEEDGHRPWRRLRP
jgi:hypothetical protein